MNRFDPSTDPLVRLLRYMRSNLKRPVAILLFATGFLWTTPSQGIILVKSNSGANTYLGLNSLNTLFSYFNGYGTPSFKDTLLFNGNSGSGTPDWV